MTLLSIYGSDEAVISDGPLPLEEAFVSLFNGARLVSGDRVPSDRVAFGWTGRASAGLGVPKVAQIGLGLGGFAGCR